MSNLIDLHPGLMTSLRHFLEELEWDYEVDEEASAIVTNFGGDHTVYRVAIVVRDEEGVAIFYSIPDVMIPETQRSVMADFLTRASFGMLQGTFEMDFEDGEVRFRTTLDPGGQRASKPAMERALFSNVLSMDRYYPGMMSVLHADMDPAEALARCEADEASAS